MKHPQLHLYFGDGKGKTTAAFGPSVRAWGGGWRVLFVQFLATELINEKHPFDEGAKAVHGIDF